MELYFSFLGYLCFVLSCVLILFFCAFCFEYLCFALCFVCCCSVFCFAFIFCLRCVVFCFVLFAWAIKDMGSKSCSKALLSHYFHSFVWWNRNYALHIWIHLIIKWVMNKKTSSWNSSLIHIIAEVIWIFNYMVTH